MTLRIRDVLKDQGKTVVSLATQIGITQPNMSNIVNGKTMPSLETLERIAIALEVDITELFEKQGDFVAFVRRNGATHTFESEEALKEFVGTFSASE